MELHTIYKYLPLVFAERLAHEGSLKIGTLRGYQNIERLGREIGDKDEGISIEFSHDKEVKTGDKLNPLERAAMQVGPGMIVVGNYIERRHVSPNLYIFCASISYDPSILEQLNKDYPRDKYDACVKITNLKDFVDEINLVFSDKGRFIGCFKCTYLERKFHHTKKMPHPAIIKEPRYSYQKEVRMIWEPNRKNNIEPECLTIDKIKNYCSLC